MPAIPGSYSFMEIRAHSDFTQTGVDYLPGDSYILEYGGRSLSGRPVSQSHHVGAENESTYYRDIIAADTNDR